MNTIEIIRSKRRTIALEIKSDLRVIVRAPLRMRIKDIQKFIDSKAVWLEKHLDIMAERQSNLQARLSDVEIERLSELAERDFAERVVRFSAVMGVSVNRITIRHQRARWGSCSANGNLSFNCLLMLCPEEIRDYIVVHELAHRKELNHAPRFWAQVEKQLPDYKERRRWLKSNGSAIIGRLQ